MKKAIDLACGRIRGYVLASSDQAFTSGAQLLSGRAIVPGEGWQSKRRRDSGHDWLILRLGVPGIVEGLEIDTTGHEHALPTQLSLEGCTAPHTSSADALQSWEPLLVKSALGEGPLHRFSLPNKKRYSHVRLNIFPDGGVARVRILGYPVPSWMAPGTSPPAALDLASLLNGGQVGQWSDAIEECASVNLLFPDPAGPETAGWTTRRRRQSGHEWLTVKLCAPGRVNSVTVDTEGVEGDCPVKISLKSAATPEHPKDDEWQRLLSSHPVLPNTEHVYSSQELTEQSQTRWVRLNLHPDGGVSRLRVWGELSSEGLVECRLRYLNSASPGELREIFRAVCHSDRWASQMALAGPFESVWDLQKKGAGAWSHCREADWREALLGHPRIGEKAQGADLASRWSRGEQSKAATPDEALKAELREHQLRYEERFGFLFLICASGRTTEEILSSLKIRLEQSPELELQTVAEELAKIIHLRLEKLLVS